MHHSAPVKSFMELCVLRISSDSACITLDPKGGRLAEALLRGVAELTSSPEMEKSSPWQKVWQALWSRAIHFLERNSCKFILWYVVLSGQRLEELRCLECLDLNMF